MDDVVAGVVDRDDDPAVNDGGKWAGPVNSIGVDIRLLVPDDPTCVS